MELLLQDNKEIIVISDKVFNVPYNESLIHQIVTSYNTMKRKGSKAQKNRSEVSGSGKKPWRQKGTGRARAGSLRSPIWRSGGVTFAAKPKEYFRKVNKKMYKGALKIIFSELIRTRKIIVFKKFSIKSTKTSLLVKKLNKLKIDKALILLDKLDEKLFLASRNLHKVNVIHVKDINPVDLIRFKQLVITEKALKVVEELF
ncbi:50S ribosomal protein L4 [Buchnera aphidicola (Mindarus keteleerifoliae)]|uniref:50S ribosomal protein L4 n=1 Tax=Buchnera aphidicola TaxID=9 RepID=UPI0031B6FA69